MKFTQTQISELKDKAADSAASYVNEFNEAWDSSDPNNGDWDWTEFDFTEFDSVEFESSEDKDAAFEIWSEEFEAKTKELAN